MQVPELGYEPFNNCTPFCAAFSWFSLTEYVLASTIMVFHMTVVLDFPDEILMIGRPILGLSNAKNASDSAKVALSQRLQMDIGVSEDEDSDDDPEDSVLGSHSSEREVVQEKSLKNKSE